jgi:hypothetical protein
MFRDSSAFALLLILATPVAAQVPIDSLAPQTRVRLDVPHLKLSNHTDVLDSLRRDTLFLHQVWLPEARITRMYASLGKVDRGEAAARGARRGARIGSFAALGFLGYALLADRSCNDCMISATAVAVVAFPVFVGVGALGGAAMGAARPPEAWIRVRLHPAVR